MSLMDKAKDKAQQAMGAVQQKTGQAAGNDDLKETGQANQTEGEFKEGAHGLEDKAKSAVQDAKDKLPGNN